MIQTESPRGEILDANGKVLAQDVASWAVTVDRDLVEAHRDAGARPARGAARRSREGRSSRSTTSVRQSPLEPAVVALDVSLAKRLAILQDPEDYPGVHVMELTVRSYPHGGLAAQVLGYVGEIDADELAQLKRRATKPAT